MNRFTQVQSQKSSEIVKAQIQEQIASGRLAPGERLPSVVDLAASLQVGRSTIREALSALKATGWVDIRHGGGTFVSKIPPPLAQAQESGKLLLRTESLGEVLEVRKFMEAGCAALAAKRRTSADLAELQAIIGRMRAAVADEALSEQADAQFHLQIAKATHNTLAMDMMESMTERLEESMKASRRLWFFAERANAEQLLAEHAGIYAAIESGDEELAAHRMQQHLIKVDLVLQRVMQDRS